jgi:hypothetical protein
MVTRLDRLARSTRDLLNTLATITDRKAGFRSLGDAWADTTSAHGRLMLTVLAGLAEFERDLIRTRTGEGRERAKARGVKMGRPPKLTPHQVKEALRRRDAGEPMRNIARSYNVSHSTGPSSATAGDNKTVNIPAPTTPEQGRGKGPRALWFWTSAPATPAITPIPCGPINLCRVWRSQHSLPGGCHPYPDRTLTGWIRSAYPDAPPGFETAPSLEWVETPSTPGALARSKPTERSPFSYEMAS